MMSESHSGRFSGRRQTPCRWLRNKNTRRNCCCCCCCCCCCWGGLDVATGSFSELCSRSGTSNLRAVATVANDGSLLGTGDCNQSSEINGSRAFIEQFSRLLLDIFSFFSLSPLLFLCLPSPNSFTEEKRNDPATEGLIPLCLCRSWRYARRRLT